MPYTLDTLPEEVRRRIPSRLYEVWIAAFNEAFAQTQDEKKAFLAAWGAVNKAKRVSIKSTKDDDELIIEAWGMLFSDSETKDLDEEYFNALTMKLLEYYKDAPLWYEHGQDLDYGYEPIGKRLKVEAYPRGLWTEHS